MHLEDRIKNGMTFYEHGHTDPIDIEQEKELEAQRRHCKEVMFDYNNTRPSENVKKKEILKGFSGIVRTVCLLKVRYICLTVIMFIWGISFMPISIWSS